jgi:hypothetical protein
MVLTNSLKIGPPERIRTSDLPLRRGPRYPAVPRAEGLMISPKPLGSQTLIRI